MLIPLFALVVSCGDPDAAKTGESAPAGDATRPSSASPREAPTPAAPPGQDADPNRQPSVVKSEGQNVTYSTEGELEVVGTDINYDILLPSDVLFDFDKHDLRPEANELLRKLAAHFAGRRTNQVHVFGHTDSKGEDHYNAVLSQKRAVAVQKWLKENTGVYAMALGMGEREPLLPNENPDGSDNPENRQRNRRVTVRVALYPDVKK